jgi:hypothetical protein
VLNVRQNKNVFLLSKDEPAVCLTLLATGTFCSRIALHITSKTTKSNISVICSIRIFLDDFFPQISGHIPSTATTQYTLLYTVVSCLPFSAYHDHKANTFAEMNL